VYTIERSKKLFELHTAELSSLKGVHTFLGDSAHVLPTIIRELGNRNAVFWLDGHWSGGETAGADNECPLLHELACLGNRERDIILIDDARLFLCAPPPPHRPSEWPGIADVVDALSRRRGRPHLQVLDDVIFAVPPDDAVMRRLTSYAQDRAAALCKSGRTSVRGVLGAFKTRFLGA